MQGQKLILPFFTIQEITAVVQAQISAERKSLVRAHPNRQRTLLEFLEYRNWLSVRPDGPYGSAVTTIGPTIMATLR